MKTILSSDYFLSRIVKILGEIGFVPGCLILLVLMTMSSFASAHHLPNSIKDQKSLDLTTSFELTIRAYDSRISELTPGLDEEHPHGGSISFPTFHSKLHCQPNEGRISSPPLTSTFYPITGTVYDAGGGIPRVVVKIKGTNIFTLTNEWGQFEIDAKKGDILIFSFPDYETVEIKITEQTEINLELFPAVTQLEEAVINAGYYTVKDKERTGSISRVTAEVIENQPVSNVLAAIQGRMAGVNIIQSTGTPGSGFEVQIRGLNSLRMEGNYPLYILDGVPIDAATPSSFGSRALPFANINPLNAIHPNDIESIEVLKDADATAIYGSRGGNGVILITTKKSKGSDSFIIQTNYSLSRSMTRIKMMNTKQYLSMREMAFNNDGIDEYPSTAYDINGTWDQKRNTNWQRKLLGKTASSYSIRFALNGGSDKTHYNISGSHNEQQTVISEKFKYKTNSLMGSLSHISKNNKLNLTVTTLFSSQKNNVANNDLSISALTLSPNAPNLYSYNNQLNWENGTFENPLASLENSFNYETISFNSNINLKYEVIPSLFFNFNSGINFKIFDEFILRPSTMYNPSQGFTPSNSSVTKAYYKSLDYLVEPQINFKRKLSNHFLNLLIGLTFQQKNASNFGILASGFESNTLITNSAAANNISISHHLDSQYNYGALFGRFNYQLFDKYILNLTARRDGSSRFGPNNRFANFGAIGAAWLFSKEEFLYDLNWLSFGKLRASIGTSGSDLIGDYQFLDSYLVSNLQYGNITGLYPSRLYNPNYSWEKTEKKEIALELSLFQNRLHLTTSYFQNKSGNQLVGIPLPITTGFNNVLANLDAKVKNSGWELELTADILRDKNFSWQSNFNISFPKNELLSFPNLEGSTYANTYVIGQPITIVKLYNYEGIDTATGLYKFSDFNGDGLFNEIDDAKAIRNIGIKFFGGWHNEFNYKKFQLSFLLQFVKQQSWNYNSFLNMPGTKFNQPIEVLNVWSESNPNGIYMPYSSGMDPEKNQKHLMFMNSTAAVSDASFIRLKNVQLNYELPIKSTLKKVNVFVQGQNLITITNYFGLDPEFLIGGYTPPLKTISFGAQLNF
jgi:TonB-linked SusC/RagA family outer membrane protein